MEHTYLTLGCWLHYVKMTSMLMLPSCFILFGKYPRNLLGILKKSNVVIYVYAESYLHKITPLTRCTERPDIFHTAASTLPSSTQSSSIVDSALHIIWACSFWPSLKVWSTLQARVFTVKESFNTTVYKPCP